MKVKRVKIDHNMRTRQWTILVDDKKTNYTYADNRTAWEKIDKLEKELKGKKIISYNPLRY